MNIGIVGCGLIGGKRAAAVCAPNRLIAVCDREEERARALADRYGAAVEAGYLDLIARPDVELLIVSTRNDALSPIALAAAEKGKHVLIEKPGAVHSSELLPLMAAAARSGAKVKVGFNHRYHPAFLKAREILKQGQAGDVMFIRGRYGHGGRLGYEKEWRADKRLSGGGETIDQGVHLIDLSRWFLGDLPRVEGFAATYYWDMPVDDNGFLSLRTLDGRAAWLQVSCTEWKNMFSFEIYCKNAKLAIEGLGGSYGVERLYHYRMLPEMGPPDTEIYEFPRGDSSWKRELDDFIDDIRAGRDVSMGSLSDAYEALKIVEAIYEKSGL